MNSALARIFAAAIFVTVSLTAALAQSAKDERDCFSTNSDDYKNPSFHDIGLAACSRLINSGKYRGGELAAFYRGRANWLHRKEQLDAALSDYERAIALDPDNVYSYDYRADIFLDRGEYERAIEEYNRAIRINPRYAAAYYSRGRAYENLGRIELAKESYRAALDQPATDRVADWAHDNARKRLEGLR
jgi:tetratricopeptide (TPR) repeat protein